MLSIIYYILIILVVIILLTTLLWPDWSIHNLISSNNKNNNTGTVDEDSIEESAIDSTIDRNIESDIELKKYNHQLKLEDSIDNNTDGIKFKDFLELIKDDEFIINYKKSLLESLNEKKVIYTEKLNQCTNDLNMSRSKPKQGILGTHDSNVELLEVCHRELEDILNVIDKRIKTLSTTRIKQDFNHMLYNNKKGFASIIGRENVKDMLVLQIYSFSKNYKVFLHNFQNVAIYGNAGIGKTKLAETMSYIYAKSGILVRRKYRFYTKKDFTSQYVHESARLTYKLLLSNLEGVSFIDEAYSLASGGMGMKLVDHATEYISEIVNFLDKYIGLSIVIVAGYEKRMESEFMGSNEGMSGRFPNKIVLEDYDSEQLTKILIKFIKDSDGDIKFTEKDYNCLYTFIDYLYKNVTGIFKKQARDMKTLSSTILKTIYSSKQYDWITNDTKNNVHLLLSGINNYLKEYKIHLSL